MVSTLSGGQRKKVALAAALLSRCDILVLDEPTNHLDNDMTEYLEDYLNNYKGALVMVTHDRYFLDKVCNRIVEIDKGKTYSYNTNYEGYLMLKAERESIALATQNKHQNILRKEIAWMQRGARARSTKQKAHIQRYEKLASEELIKETQSVTMSSIASRLGNKTIELSHIAKTWPGRPSPVITDFSYNFLRTDRIGVVGPNGCGKTTLMKLITGVTKPDSGTIEIGDTVRIGYFSQENEALDPNMKVLDYVKETAEYIQTTEGLMSASTMCERFLFDGTLQHQRIEKLSGGEKRRLYLLKVLVSSPNVLILDEPTNDLDISTLCILEDYLDSFQGILIVVSHDRYFVKKVATQLLVFEDGTTNLYQFGYEQYQEKLDREASESKNVYRGNAIFGGAISQNGSSQTGGSQTGSDANRSTSQTAAAGNVGESTNANSAAQAGGMAVSSTGKAYYNPGKERSKIQKKVKKVEEDLAVKEAKLDELKAELMKPEYQSSYSKLTEIQNEIDALEEEILIDMEAWEELSSQLEALG